MRLRLIRGRLFCLAAWSLLPPEKPFVFRGWRKVCADLTWQGPQIFAGVFPRQDKGREQRLGRAARMDLFLSSRTAARAVAQLRGGL